ncbi:methyl-accepting chemotaxis protein [Paenibacillus aceti]|uniref:Methyl-accepting chemotaxis protein McpA n=1 Tax=Paenibacillus aceti TaxID=1820010 RepID=A0ABQ1W295_9BACL|nr:methyl-accepting chemotaxis protein [Paenibacillus aceti]GGG07816.1 methyl-accepting chemotaxis protein McpA [Paenibacillus aceti]
MKGLMKRLKSLVEVRSLRNRLFILFALMLIVPSIVIAIGSFNSAKTELRESTDDLTQMSAFLFNESLDRLIEAQVDNADQLAMQISSQQIDSKSPEVQKLLKLFVEKHPDTGNIVIGNNNGAWMKAVETGEEEYDPRERDWYKAALDEPDKAVIIDPFKSTSTGNYSLFVSRALPDKQGAITVSLNLSKINEMAESTKLGERGYIYVMDRNNRVVADPETEIGEEIQGEQVDKIHAAESGFINYKSPVSGNDQRVYFITNEWTGFKIVGVLEMKEIDERAMPIFWNCLIISGIALILGLAVLYFVVRAVTLPIERLNLSSKRVGEGYLNEKVAVSSKDEIGQLTGNYNSMVSTIRDIIGSVADISGQLAASSEELTASTEHNTKAVEHVVELVQNASEDAERQATSSAEGARAMEEMSQGIYRIAEASNLIASSSSQTEEDIHTGSQKVAIVAAQMSEIHRSTSESAELIRQMNEISSHVAEMGSAVADIAKKTNLLALNAAIEAARAGEEGRGFAVVAGEVRKLAEQSKDTVEQIQGRLVQMADLTQEAYTKMSQDVVTNVERGMSVTDDAQVAFRQIEQSTKQILEQIQDVSAITEQMSASADEVAASVAHIAETSARSQDDFQSVTAATEQQLASMEEIASAAEGLAQIATSMHSKVEYFKLDKEKE